MPLKSIDLFAGIGGIRKGFDLAFGDEIETVFVSEIDKYAKKTYRANYDTPEVLGGDIRDIDPRELPDFQICLAGFPCQAFSLAGKRQGLDDAKKRGRLFFNVVDICKVKQPLVVFCENSKGLVGHRRGETLREFVRALEDAGEFGYRVFSHVLNSKDFGVPQNRERVYLVAIRNDVREGVGKDFVFPLGELQGSTIADIVEQEPVSAKYYLSETYLDTLKKHKARHQARGNGFGYIVRSTDDIAGTIVCGGMGRERNLLKDERQQNLTPVTHIKGAINQEGIRRMTPREWARLQGLPDDFVLDLSDTQLYKQLGNCVTVSVIQAVAESIKTYLSNIDLSKYANGADEAENQSSLQHDIVDIRRGL